ncbi:MAG: P-II family nitrogen regulator [Streptosporangiales bacterium]|nr:P-II family nitrogen regulator [Streptosporangiales bacterium]
MGMRRVAAIIRPERLHDVQRRLEEIGSPGFTISDVRGHGHQGVVRGSWRGEPYVLHVVHKIQVEVLCADDQVDLVAKTIIDAARTGHVGDGIVYASPIDHIWEIRTAQEGLGP